MSYDIFIVSAPKDQNKLRFVLEAVVANLKGFENIYICTPSWMDDEFISTLHFPINYRIDMQVLKAIPQKWKHRPSWVYQQFLKLFQNETKNDYYFVVDSDTIINKPMEVFDICEDVKPIWRTSWEQNNRPYYNFQEKMFGYGRVYNHSFLADMGFYSKSIVREMLSKFDYTIDSFIAKTYQIVNKECYPSEADIYMSYVIKHHPDKYVIKHIDNKCDAKHHDNPLHHAWSEEDVRQHINKMRFTNYHTFALHSWCDRSHNQWSRK